MARVKEHFDDDALVELTGLIAFQNLSSKFNDALNVAPQGVCRLPPAHPSHESWQSSKSVTRYRGWSSIKDGRGAQANSARLKAIRRAVPRHIRLLTDRSTPGNPEQDVPFCPQR